MFSHLFLATKCNSTWSLLEVGKHLMGPGLVSIVAVAEPSNLICSGFKCWLFSMRTSAVPKDEQFFTVVVSHEQPSELYQWLHYITNLEVLCIQSRLSPSVGSSSILDSRYGVKLLVKSSAFWELTLQNVTFTKLVGLILSKNKYYSRPVIRLYLEERVD